MALRRISVLVVWPDAASCSKRSFNSGDKDKLSHTASLLAVASDNLQLRFIVD